MTRYNKLKSVTSLLLLFFIPAFLFADFIIDYDYGYALDIPEGYDLADVSEDKMTYMFTHKNIPVTFVIKLYDNEKNNLNELDSSKEALKITLEKLSAAGSIDIFQWSNSRNAISQFQMTLDQAYSGWAVSSPVKGTTGTSSSLVLLCYAPDKYIDQCQKFILSTLNSLCINKEYYNTPGIITTYAFPKTGTRKVTATIAGNKITANLDKSDEEAAQFVIDMEYTILNYYGNHQLWQEAWERYYRIIYRDSYGRLSNFSKAVYEKLYQQAKRERPDNPEIQYAQYILSWVQTFQYTRDGNKAKSDFTNLPSIISGAGSDCDSRSMLVATLLKSSGIDSLLLISPEFAHALVAARIEAPGQTYHNPENGEEYLIGETTAKVTWGMMAQEQSDRTKWFYVSFN